MSSLIANFILAKKITSTNCEKNAVVQNIIVLKKPVHKFLVKSTFEVNFTNILYTAFAPFNKK